MSSGAYKINALKADVALKAYTSELGSAAFADVGSGTGEVLSKAIADALYEPVGGALVFPFFLLDDYGAVGDGVTNDRTAIINCLTAAAGRKVYLTAGKSYRITSTITHTGSVDIETLGGKPAEIYASSNSIANLLNITNNGSAGFDSATNWKTSKSLTTSMTIGLNGWVLDSVTGVQAGDLMQVVSSQLYYGDNRGTVKKSELHKVQKVVGNTVYSEAGAFESYNTASETVTVGFIAPISVKMKDVNFRSISATTTTGMARGVRMWGVDEALIENVNISGFSILGLWLNACYRPTVRGGSYANANDTSSTGYGIQSYGTTFLEVSSAKFWNNRRGIDVSGSPYISRSTQILYCKSYGTSSSSPTNGNPWWPPISGVPSEDSFAFGCHSGSDGVYYEGCVVYDTAYPFVRRGRNVVIKDCKVYGHCRYLVGASYNDNLTIDGLEHSDGYSALANGNVYITGLNEEDRYPTAIVAFNQFSNDSDLDQIEIRNCRATVRRGILWTTILTNQPNNVILKDNHVRIRPEDGFTGPIGYLAHTESNSGSNSGPRAGWIVQGNTFKRESGVTNIIKDYVNWTFASDVRQDQTYTHTVTVLNNSVQTIDAPSASSSCRVAVDCRGVASGCVQVVQGLNESRAWGTVVSLATWNAPLTGTTGSSGFVTVALQDNKLYVENRTGATRTITVTFLHGI